MSPLNKITPKQAVAIVCVLVGSTLLAGLGGFAVALIVIGVGLSFTTF